MRSLLATTTLLLLGLLIPLAQASHLRSHCSNATMSDCRLLQQGPSPKNSVLNILIRAVLPSINRAIQENVPDPLNLDLSASYDLGSVNLGCGSPGSATFTFNLADIAGLSTIFIDAMEVVEGTDSLAGCLDQPWSATFNMAIASTGTLAVNDLGAAFRASACGLNINQGVGGNILTVKSTLGGMVDMAGNLCAGVISIDSATILDTLTVGWDTITADLTGVPPQFAAVVRDVTTQLSADLQDQLLNVVEPRVRPIIQEQLNFAIAFAPAVALPIQAAAIRNQAGERVRGFLNAGAQFLGWGGDGDD